MLSADTSILSRDLCLEWIESYLNHGAENAISAAELTKAVGLSDTRITRKIIEKARCAGSVILSDDNGYYLMSEDTEQALRELESYVRRVDARCISNRAAAKSAKALLKSMTPTEITGQGDIWHAEQ